MLFSEPKIPQSNHINNSPSRSPSVSVLFSEPKIPQYFRVRPTHHLRAAVSVLFSEPKIPQSAAKMRGVDINSRFSALQRAENSSMMPLRRQMNRRHADVSVLFSEPKIPQCSAVETPRRWCLRFQCSSASRKFLNRMPAQISRRTRKRFSALQRAENSSMEVDPEKDWEPPDVSVLFSEPKIPQFLSAWVAVAALRFQCSSASRKFLNLMPSYSSLSLFRFQCSSASRKFLNAYCGSYI